MKKTKKNFKSLLSLALSIFMILGMISCVFSVTAFADTTVWDGTATDSFAGGNGNWDNPFIIETPQQLAYMATVLNSGTGTAYQGKNIKLANDIYLNDVSNYDSWGTTAPANVWTSLGYFTSASAYRDFGGTFDGNNHTIYGLYTAGTENKGTGLFGAVNNATIKNLHIDKAYVGGTAFIGGFAGIARGNTTFTNCSFNGTVKGSSNQVGGFVGKYDGSSTTMSINSCSVKGAVAGTESASALAGGFIGFQAGTSTTVNVNNSYVAAGVTGHDTIGGIVGRLNSDSNTRVLNVRKSHLYGAVKYKGQNWASNCGTIAGQYNANSTINVNGFYYFSTQYTNADGHFNNIDGTKKTQTEFKDGTVVALLNEIEVDSATDLYTWKQSENYPTFNNITGDVLTNLVDSQNKIAFAAETKTYDIAVTSTTESITLTPTYSAIGCYVTINDAVVASGVASSPIALVEGNNTILVKVYEEAGLLTQYTVNVFRRKAADVGTVWSGQADADFESGKGLWDDPYIIATAEQLALLANNVNGASGNYYSGRYFKLISDIYLNDDIADYDTWDTTSPENLWSPIGNATGTFGGIFDGDGHTVYGMYVNGTDSGTAGYGLFGHVGYNGTVKNVNVKNSYVFGKLSVGGIVGQMDGAGTQTIENCSFDGIVDAATASSYQSAGGFVGGIVGLVDGTNNKIIGCFSSGTVYCQRYVSGMVGNSRGTSLTIDNCYSTMTVSSKGSDLDWTIGGFIGRNERCLTVNISDSYFNGNFSITAGHYKAIIGSQAKDGATINVTNVYYNNTFGASDYGTAKTSAEFADGTVAKLLYDAASDDAVWQWMKGSENPVKAIDKPADVNNDGAVNIIDLVSLKKYLAKYENAMVVINNADIDPTLIIDAVDLSALVQVLLEGDGTYMIRFVCGQGKQNGQFGQSVSLDVGTNYVYSFEYNMDVKGGLRPLVAYTDSQGNQVNISTKSILDSTTSKEVYEFTVPSEADLGGGKADIKVGVKSDILSAGAFTGFKLAEENTTDNLLVNPNFADGLYGWMDASYFTITNKTTFVGKNHEVVVVPYIGSLFVEKVYEDDDSNYDNTTWANSISAPVITGNDTDWIGSPSTATMTLTGGADNEAAAKKTAILNTANSAYSGTTYYISANGGDDSKDGKSTAKAWKTTAKLLTTSFKSGDVILFERGGVYRLSDTFNIPSGVTVSAYGTGDKPIITGSVKNYAKVTWTASKKTNVWKYNLGSDDAGLIVFNHGELSGNKVFCVNDLAKEGDFFHNTDTGVLYLYCAGNYPSAKYSDIEIGVRKNLLFVQSNVTDVTVDNLSLKYCGAHAFGTMGKNQYITVKNCEFAWIGGSCWDKSDAQNPELRYGNAIQFWNSASNCTATNNYIYQVYDAGITYQGDEDETYSNITFTDNLIEYCTYNFELNVGSNSTLSNVTVSGNILRFAGYGFGSQRPDEIRGAHITIGYTIPVTGSDFSITGNILDCSNLWTVHCGASADEYPGLSISGNTYYQRANKYDFAVWYLRHNLIYAFNAADYSAAIAVIDANATVTWLS